MKERYTIEMVTDAVIDDLQHNPHRDVSVTTIRCAINDVMDYAEREGYKVNHGYSQERAVKKVKAALAIIWKYDPER